MAFIDETEAFAVKPSPERGTVLPEHRVPPEVQAERDASAGQLLVSEYKSREAAERDLAELRKELPRTSGDGRGILQGHIARLEAGLKLPESPSRVTATLPQRAAAPVAGPGNFISELEATGIAPPPSLWERAKTAWGEATTGPLQTRATEGLQQVGQEIKALTNMFVGLPGGVAGVGMDALSRLSSLMYGQDAKTAGKTARMVADQVNEDWGKITKTLGLQQDAKGSKIEHLMNWALEASDKGGTKLEAATKGVLSLETTQSVRDTLLNLLGVKGLGAVKPRGNASMEALTGKPKAPEAPAAPSVMESLTEPPPPKPPTKAELKAQAEAVDSLVVDKAKLKEIFGIAKGKGAEAEAALVKNIFDRVLQPQKISRIEPRVREAGAFGPEPLQGPPAPPPRPVVLAAIEKKGRGELLTTEEARALRQGEIDVAQVTPLVGSAMEKLRDGKLISAQEAKALRRLDVDVEGGVIKGPNGKVLFERGQADPRLLGVLTAMGVSALAAPHIVDWWNNSGGLSGDNARDAALGLGAAGAAGVMKPKGGMWHVEAASKLAQPLIDALTKHENLGVPDWAVRVPGDPVPAAESWATSAVSKYLNRYAGTAADPIKDLKLPSGARWEDLTDKAFTGTTLTDGFSPGAYPGAKLGETVYKAEIPSERGNTRPASQAAEQIHAYLAHVGDYLKSQNLTPEQLQRMDLPRAIRETVANDERIQKLAYEEYTKPQPDKIANNDALPTLATYVPVKEPKRTFSFKDDKSTTNMATKEIELPSEEIQYSWKELALPAELTPEQSKRIDLRELKPGWSTYVAVDAKGNPIKDNFSGAFAAGIDPPAAYLAGELAREGNSMAHCVGGYSQDVLSGKSRILSLRDQYGRSYATVEIKPAPFVDEVTRKRDFRERVLNHPRDEITQIYGPGNGAPAEYVKPYIQDLVKNQGPWDYVQNLDHAGMVEGFQPGEYLTEAEYTKIRLPRVEEKLQYMERLEKDGGYGREGFTLESLQHELKTLRWIRDNDLRIIAEAESAPLRAVRQAGNADPKLLAGIAAGTAAALYLQQNSPDDFIKAAIALAGTVGVTKGRFADMPLKEVVETYKTATGRSKELAAAKIYEDTHRQLERSINNMGKDLPVEDIAQEVYANFFKGLDSEGGYRGDGASVSTYLHSMAKNEVVDFFRLSRERMARATESYDVGVPGEEGAVAAAIPEAQNMQANPEAYKSAYDMAAQNDLAKLMDRAIEKLPEQQRDIFRAYELEGLDYQAIADKFNMPVGTVRSNLSRARENLQSSLRGYKDYQAGRVSQEMLTGLGAISGGAAIGMLLDSDRDVRSAVYGALAAGVLGTGAGRGALKAAIKSPDAALGLLSTRLGNIAPALKFRLREHEHRILVQTDRANDQVLPFVQAFEKLPGTLQQKAGLALMNGDMRTIASIPQIASHYAGVQKFLAAIGEQLRSLGRFGEGVSEYFPRLVKDFEGLKAAMGQEARVGLEKLLVEAEAKMLRKNGRSLTDVEESLIVNRYLFAPDESSFQPGFAKSRGLKEVPENLQQFYASPTESLLRYVSGAINDLETARFFGRDLATKGKKGRVYNDVDGSIGNLTRKLLEEGKITREQEGQLRDMLKARFEGGERGMKSALADVRNLTNTGLLGNVASAATQLGDSLMTIYHHGLIPTMQALAEKLTGQARLAPKDLGLINHVAEELSGMGWSGALLHTTMKYSGFHAIDMFAKGLGVNAALIKWQKDLRAPKGEANFRAKYTPMFEERIGQVMEDIRQGRRTPDTDLMAFNELSDTQPVSKAEMPELYLKHPNGRLLYQLKTYMLKQVDIVRRDAYQEIAKGTPEGIARGTKNLMALATMYALSNIPGDLVKDWLSGRDVDLFKTPDLTENVLKTFGLNRYATEKIKSGKATETVLGMATPPVKVLEDIAKLDENAIKYIPLAGRPVSDRYFGGNERKEIADTKYENKYREPGTAKKPLSPAAKQYLREKRLKDKQAKLAKENAR